MIYATKTIKDLRIQLHTSRTGEGFVTIWKANEFHHTDQWTPTVRRYVRNLLRVSLTRLGTIPAAGLQQITWR